MRKSMFLFSWFLVLSLAATPIMAGSGNANFLLGYRQLSDDEVEDVELEALEGQPVVGITVDFQTGDLPFNWALGLYQSSREEEESIFGGSIDVEFTFTELSFGVLRNWESGAARPFVGGGLTYMEGEVELSAQGQSESEDDNSAALYGEGGVYWRLGAAFNIGVGGRIVVGTDMDLDGADLNGDYAQVGLILGWGWD